MKNVTSLNHTKLLLIAHVDSSGLGLYWDEIDHHIENILELHLHYNYSTVQ